MGIINNTLDTGTDLIEKVSSPSSRSGSTVERAGKMAESGVSLEVIALQMTKNSPNNHTYSVTDVKSYNKLYQDAQTKVVLTAKQTRALINDNLTADSDFNDSPAYS